MSKKEEQIVWKLIGKYNRIANKYKVNDCIVNCYNPYPKNYKSHWSDNDSLNLINVCFAYLLEIPVICDDNIKATTVPNIPPSIKIVFDPPISYISVEMTCLFNSYKNPPTKTKIKISNGPALPITAEKAIQIVNANLKAPHAVLPKVL